MNYRYLPGLRSVKTAVAVFVCLAVSILLRRENAFYACIAAVVCMQPTHEQSVSLGIQRTIGTVVGGIVGFLALVAYTLLPLHWSRASLLLLPLFLLLAIYVCNVLGQEKSTAICCIVFLSIALNHGDTVAQAIVFAANRVLDTVIGILAAILVNRFLFPRFSREQEDE